jgi:hypothetical protein
MDALTLSNATTLWPSLSQHIVDNYDILFAANLLWYDHDMGALLQELEKFQNYSFSPNQRLLFSLYDTEFYYPGATVGFTLNNLQQILQTLNIEPTYCILTTNHHGIRKSLREQGFSIFVSENNFCTVQSTMAPFVNGSLQKIFLYNFCFLSHTKREHRMFTRLWIEEHALDKTLMSWHSKPDYFDYVLPNLEFNQGTTSACTFVTTTPFTRINNQVKYTDAQLTDLYNKHFSVLVTNHKHPSITTKPLEDHFSNPWLNDCFTNVVTETVFNYPYPYLTEKTFNCFGHYSPFVLIGAHNSLQYLQSIGFRTFGQWFDESYDTIVQPEKRLLSAFDTLKSISNWSLSHCQDVYNDMIPVLKHNYEHFQSFFCNELLLQTKKELSLI